MANDTKLNGEWQTIGGRLFYVLRGQGRFIRLRVFRYQAPHAPQV